MRHRRRGRHLNKSTTHRAAMIKNMACSLLLSERSPEVNEAGFEYDSTDTPASGRNAPKVSGRIVTTIAKAKELRPYIERCITVARKALPHLREAEKYATKAEQLAVKKDGTPDEAVRQQYKEWRKSDDWAKWSEAMGPALAARRRAVQLLGNQRAVEILFDEIAPRFEDRQGGYTRILRLANVRLGDAGQQAIIEFVGNSRDRVKQESERPAFDDDAITSESVTTEQEATTEEVSEEESNEEAVEQSTETSEDAATEETSANETDEEKKES